MNIFPDNKGVSLPLVIGLMLLLVTITTTVNELVIRSLRAARQIEASDKAYFAAEAGIEDALYELSAHGAGYETPALGSAGVRQADFSGGLKWKNEWQIKSREINNCNEMSAWVGFSPVYCGRIYEGQKVTIPFYRDNAFSSDLPMNHIGTDLPVLQTLRFSPFVFKLRLPRDLVAANLPAFSLPPISLKIDNDGDWTPTNNRVNEDGPLMYGYPLNTCPYSGGTLISDNDCDGLVDEDSPHDPVVLWRLIDDAGHSFQPLRGCKDGVSPDPPFASTPGYTNSQLCEKSFMLNGNELSTFIQQASATGINQDGLTQVLQTFMGSLGAAATYNLQMEILPVVPFEAIDTINQVRIRIPYLEYGIAATIDASAFPPGANVIPSTYFSVRSDGYFQDFKQSITTNVYPQATTRLLDLTVIQQ